MSTHRLKLFRFSNFTNSVHAVADFPGAQTVVSRWRCWLVVALLAGIAQAAHAQFYQPNYITNNGDFEAVTLPPGGSINYGPGPVSVNGWTYSGDAGITNTAYNPYGKCAYLQASATPGSLQRIV